MENWKGESERTRTEGGENKRGRVGVLGRYNKRMEKGMLKGVT